MRKTYEGKDTKRKFNNCKDLKKLSRQTSGITLVALVITIIILLILASISIAMLTDENGILAKAEQTKEEAESASANEETKLNQIAETISGNSTSDYIKSKGVNKPKLLSGMKEVMFQLPDSNNKGYTIANGEDGFDSSNWYDYNTGKWANAQTQDGSYWVWIPRYAYKITYNDASDKSQGGTIDVKFLVGTTDQYYDEKGELQTAQRAKSADETVDTTTDYYVHPAFTNESSINYANGGWDKELTGIWVAKFEAGYASGNNNAEVRASSVNYTESTVFVNNIEAGTTSSTGGSGQLARNWLDGIYGETQTSIKYPVFQPKTYSMNYITPNDAYNISKVLTEGGNIYGLNSSSTDSHLMKDSEWGAVAYLGHSKYGTNGVEIYLNNINLNSGSRKRTEVAGKSGVDSAYAVTGVTTATTSSTEKNVEIGDVNSTTGNTASNGVYTWDQETGQKASSTGNMYGVFDMSGGVWERTAGYIANENGNLQTYGLSITYSGNTLKTISTKYTTVYPFDSNKDTTTANLNTAMRANYTLNTKIFGDAIRETSDAGTGANSWNGDYSCFLIMNEPFMMRSGDVWNTSVAGLFYFNNTTGVSSYDSGFRTVLVAI